MRRRLMIMMMESVFPSINQQVWSEEVWLGNDFSKREAMYSLLTHGITTANLLHVKVGGKANSTAHSTQ